MFRWLCAARRCCGMALVLFFGAVGWPASSLAAAPVPPSAEDFVQLPLIDNVVISPSGRRMALLVPGPNGRIRLGVMDLDPVSEPRVVASFGDANVKSVWWVNDDRLLFEGFQDGAVIRSGGGGLFAVDHDAGQLQQLIAWSHHTERENSRIVSRVLPYGWFFHSVVDDGSDDIFVQKQVLNAVGDVVELQLSRLNTRTRSIQSLNFGIPQGTRHWLLDASREPRAVVTLRNSVEAVHWREASGKWQEVASFNAYSDNARGSFYPLKVDDAGKLLVISRGDGDVDALYSFDPVTRRMDPQPMVRVAGFDLRSTLETDSRTDKLLGVHTVLDRPTSVWFDEDIARVQNGIDAALPPGRINRLYCGRCATTKFFVVHSSSDRQPGEYFLFNRSKLSMQPLGLARPRIPEASQARRSFHRFAARDGLSVPLVVTHPIGHEGPSAQDKRALPAVVLVHGGPYVRGGSLQWSEQAQFLASRGWRVLEPEFRGGMGFGLRHHRAGWKQWGGAMQHDLVDTIAWAAQQGWVDPQRVCVVGASYGGYAALMASILHPKAFRCAASFAGVTDINLLYDISWSDISEQHKQYGMPVLVGDPQKDAALLAAASPLLRVKELKIALLLAHGGEDRRVPIDHFRQFVSAARSAGLAIESKEYPSEGHGFFDPANAADHYQMLERFLKKHLHPASP
jgi:dienelactone hydrolase